MRTTITDYLPLDRPLIIFDLETTGLSTVEDKIIEIAYEKIMPSGEIIAEVMRINPGMPIPEVATKINGISDADVADAPSFATLAFGLWNTFDGADVARTGLFCSIRQKKCFSDRISHLTFLWENGIL